MLAVRAVIALLRAELPLNWETSMNWDYGRKTDFDVPRETISALSEWVLCPCQRHQEEVTQLTKRLTPVPQGPSKCERNQWSQSERKWVEDLLLPIATSIGRHGALGHRVTNLLRMRQARSRTDARLWHRARTLTVQRALLPWALGGDDPLPEDLREDKNVLAASRAKRKIEGEPARREARKTDREARQRASLSEPLPPNDALRLVIRGSVLRFHGPDRSSKVCNVEPAGSDECGYWHMTYWWSTAELFRVDDTYVVRVTDHENRGGVPNEKTHKLRHFQSLDKGWSWEPTERTESDFATVEPLCFCRDDR